MAAGGYEIVRADLSRDRDQILAIWSNNLRAHTPAQHAARYDWLCRCPAGPPRIWLVSRAGKPVGAAGVSLREVSLRGRTVLAGIAEDLAVDPAHRVLHPALMLQRAVLGALDDGLAFIYGLPNQNAGKVFQRLGYQSAGALARYVKVVRTSRFLGRAGGWRRALAPLAPAADQWLRLRWRAAFRRPRPGRACETPRDFDSRFDELWSRVAPASMLAGVRSSAFLRWRYGQCPVQDYVTLALVEGDRVLGYVTAWGPGPDGQVRVADFMAAESDGIAAEVLAGLVRWAHAAGAASVAFECLAPAAQQPLLERLGFAPRGRGHEVFVAAQSGKEGGGVIELAKGWRFLHGDENVNTQ